MRVIRERVNISNLKIEMNSKRQCSSILAIQLARIPLMGKSTLGIPHSLPTCLDYFFMKGVSMETSQIGMFQVSLI